MTPYQDLAAYGTTVVQWDPGRVDYSSPEPIPLSMLYKTPDGRHITRDAYRVARARLRRYEFYATRVVGDTVIKIRCTRREVSELHGFVWGPGMFTKRLGCVMGLVKDDDPCSDDVLSRHLEDASLVTGWKKDEEGIMRPVYRHSSTVLSCKDGSTIRFIDYADGPIDTEWVGLNEGPPYSEEHA